MRRHAAGYARIAGAIRHGRIARSRIEGRTTAVVCSPRKERPGEVCLDVLGARDQTPFLQPSHCAFGIRTPRPTRGFAGARGEDDSEIGPSEKADTFDVGHPVGAMIELWQRGRAIAENLTPLGLRASRDVAGWDRDDDIPAPVVPRGQNVLRIEPASGRCSGRAPARIRAGY
jgi:hypothetical protein